MKKTIILGASPKEERYSNMCVKLLQKHSHPTVAIGIQEVDISNVTITKGTPYVKGVHTIAIYLSPEKQIEYYNYIIDLKPERIIFTPGAENKELKTKARAYGIETINACPLLMLTSGVY